MQLLFPLVAVMALAVSSRQTLAQSNSQESANPSNAVPPATIATNQTSATNALQLALPPITGCTKGMCHDPFTKQYVPCVDVPEDKIISNVTAFLKENAEGEMKSGDVEIIQRLCTRYNGQSVQLVVLDVGRRTYASRGIPLPYLVHLYFDKDGKVVLTARSE